MKKFFVILNILFLFVCSVYAKTYKTGIIETTPVDIVAEWPIGPGTSIGEHFTARVIENVVSERGEVFIPKNSRVIGVIKDIKNAGSFHRSGEIDILFEKIIFPDNVTSIDISADGDLIKRSHIASTALEGVSEVLIGAAKGAVTGFKFGGLLSLAGSEGSNITIAAGAGAAIALVSFIAKKGHDVEIVPGMPMMLTLNYIEKQDYKAQELKVQEISYVKAQVKKVTDDFLKVEITNDLNQDIPLSNLKIVDALGYTTRPQIEYKYFDKKSIPAHSSFTYDFNFSIDHKDARFWLVLTDSFGKQEYFRKALN